MVYLLSPPSVLKRLNQNQTFKNSIIIKQTQDYKNYINQKSIFIFMFGKSR